MHPEGSEEKENIPEHAEGSYLRSDHQTPNCRQMKAIFECAEGLNASFNLPLSLLSTSRGLRGPLPRKEPERSETLGNQTLAVSNLSNTELERHPIP